MTGSDDRIRALAERFLAPLYPSPGGRPQTLELLPEAVPSDVPFEVILPPAARLVGSQVRRADGHLVSAVVLLDVPDSPDDVLTYYRQVLSGRGWHSRSIIGWTRSGFVAMPVRLQVDFWRAASGPRLAISAGPAATGEGSTMQGTRAMTDVRLHIDLHVSQPLSQGMHQSPGSDLIPPLHAPEGVGLRQVGGGGGGSGWHSEAVAEAGASAAALEQHFARQLAASGWTRVSGGADGPFAASTWLVTRDRQHPGNQGGLGVQGAGDTGQRGLAGQLSQEAQWHGVLSIVELPGQRRFFLHVTVIWTGAPSSDAH